MTQDLQRRANTAAVLRVLATGGPASVTELRGTAGLSRPTLEVILAELVATGMIRPQEPGGGESDRTRGAGRPARRYAIDPDAAFVAGVDVGRHEILVMIADIDSTIRVTHRAAVPSGADGPELLQLVERAVQDATDELGIRVDQLRSLAVGVPGVVDSEGRLSRSVVVPRWSGSDIRAQLAEWAGADVELVNDANLAALAEQWRGAARNHRDVLYLLAGWRARASIMIDGQIVTGRHGEAGEIGSVPELFFDTPGVLLGDSSATSAQVAAVFAKAAAGEADSQVRVDRYCAELARTIRFMTAVLDPEVVVIGGGLSGAGERIVEGLRAHLASAADPRGWRTPLTVSALTDSAVALGGVRRAQLTAAAADPLVDAVIAARTSNHEEPDHQGKERP
ncbi:ROK family transcriptional regulator [Occultella glacieicola]|uniref:ROK family transcriptional regulator n=1 Tax=Occultella glacieicola TaxID=2518684 RepID=A0ABY2E0T8_9MICO|nr:ROK family protein [Occultella glacieicola]TDE88832.1 ROK family transcriptional regulator [Occultella glacieicola]